jgi:Holliday junction DNA helicase RuvA
MIGRLRGEILEKQPPMLLIEVQGVGYELFAPMSTFYHLPESGDVLLHTHLSVSENAHQLYGFATKEERSLFRQLIKVSGVGPKMALAVLSTMEPNDVVVAIVSDNIVALSKVPGVGKKTAERLVIEMRDRVKDWQLPSGPAVSAGQKSPERLANTILAEAESAMVSLGYKPAEASKVINKIAKEHPVTRSEDLIRLALRSMLP